MHCTVPHTLVTTSQWVMDKDPLASVAVAMPVALVVVFAGNSRVRLAGTCNAGGVVSTSFDKTGSS